ncbi:hypothetical protein YPPY25_0828, partial [Yersinia pestis PY-25]
MRRVIGELDIFILIPGKDAGSFRRGIVHCPVIVDKYNIAEVSGNAEQIEVGVLDGRRITATEQRELLSIGCQQR